MLRCTLRFLAVSAIFLATNSEAGPAVNLRVFVEENGEVTNTFRIQTVSFRSSTVALLHSTDHPSVEIRSRDLQALADVISQRTEYWAIPFWRLVGAQEAASDLDFYEQVGASDLIRLPGDTVLEGVACGRFAGSGGIRINGQGNVLSVILDYDYLEYETDPSVTVVPVRVQSEIMRWGNGNKTVLFPKRYDQFISDGNAHDFLAQPVGRIFDASMVLNGMEVGIQTAARPEASSAEERLAVLEDSIHFARQGLLKKVHAARISPLAVLIREVGAPFSNDRVDHIFERAKSLIRGEPYQISPLAQQRMDQFARIPGKDFDWSFGTSYLAGLVAFSSEDDNRIMREVNRWLARRRVRKCNSEILRKASAQKVGAVGLRFLR